MGKPRRSDVEVIDAILNKYLDTPEKWYDNWEGYERSDHWDDWRNRGKGLPVSRRCILNALVAAHLDLDVNQAVPRHLTEEDAPRKRPRIVRALRQAIAKLFPERYERTVEALKDTKQHISNYKVAYIFNDDSETTYEDIRMVLKEARYELEHEDG